MEKETVTPTAPPPQVNTAVSPSVDPSILDAAQITDALRIGRAADGTPVLHPTHAASRAAMDTMHKAGAALAEAERAIAATDEPAASRRLRAGAEKRLAEVSKAAATAVESIDAHRLKVVAEIDTALGVPESREQVTAAMRASDIRAHVRTLPTPTARMEALRSAISADDREAAAAALSASPLALGLSAKDVAILRDFAERRFAPQLVTLRSGLDRVRDIVGTADRVTAKRFGALVGKGDTDHARAEAALRDLEGGAA